MQIQNNIASVNSSRNQKIIKGKLDKSLEKLSSGFRINRAGDDAAGLAISELMRSQIRGLDQAMRNVNDGVSMTNTGEGALTEIHSMLQRMKTLAVQSANGTYSSVARENIESERLQLLEYFDAFSTAELSRHIKPAPDIFVKAAELLGCSCTECLAIEDSRNGLIAAARAGMPCLIVPNKITESSDFTGCYRKLSSLKELKLEELIADFQSS